MNQAQRELLESFEKPSLVQEKVIAEPQKLRTFAQGVSFGFADEIEAAVRSLVPESMGGRDYEVISGLRRPLFREMPGHCAGLALYTPKDKVFHRVTNEQSSYTTKVLP